MPIIKWNVGLLVGIREMDHHHQHLVRLLNDTYDEFREGVDVPESFIEELIRLTADHFSYEERLMTEVSYPHVDQHRNEHRLFSGRIMELQKSYLEKKDVSVDLLWFLCNWVTHHMRQSDADLGLFLELSRHCKGVNQSSMAACSPQAAPAPGE